MKVFVATQNEKIIKEIAEFVDLEPTKEIKDAHLVVFPDEERELHPAFYGQTAIFKDYSCNPIEDAKLVRYYMHAMKEYQNVIGFGSGAIFVSAMEGANIIPKARGHVTEHRIKTADSSLMTSVGSHMQLMNPFVLEKCEYTLLSYSEPRQQSLFEFDDGKYFEGQFIEPEIVYYPFGSLAIQSPIYRVGQTRPYYLFCQGLVKRLNGYTLDNDVKALNINPYE